MKASDNNGRKRNRYNDDDLAFVREKRGKRNSDKRSRNRERTREKNSFLNDRY